jgi:hypothetical protein
VSATHTNRRRVPVATVPERTAGAARERLNAPRAAMSDAYTDGQPVLLTARMRRTVEVGAAQVERLRAETP